MNQHVRILIPISKASLAALLVILVMPVHASHAADDCLAKPNAAAPDGSHWYYHVHRATGRQCWYLGSAGRNVPQHASQDAPSVPPRPAKMNTPPEPRMPVQPIATTAAAEAGAGQSVPFAPRVDQANTVADDPVMNSSAPSNIATSSSPVESSSGSIWNSAIEE
jgi:hypothetical protein